MWTLYFQRVKTKRAIAQLQRWRGWCSVFKVRGGCLKGTETDLGSFPWNKEVKAELLFPTSLSLFCEAWRIGREGGRARMAWGRAERGERTEQLPLNQFLCANIKHLHSLWPTPPANINATSICELNVPHVGQMAQPSQCTQFWNKWIAA